MEYLDLPSKEETREELVRVKKKRVMTEKQKQNWVKALAKRRENLLLRKQAKERVREYEDKIIEENPDILQRQQALKKLLEVLLAGKNQEELPLVETIVKPKQRKERKPKQTQVEATTGAVEYYEEDEDYQEVHPDEVRMREFEMNRRSEAETLQRKIQEAERNEAIARENEERRLKTELELSRYKPVNAKPSNSQIVFNQPHRPVNQVSSKKPALVNKPQDDGINIFR